MARRARRWTGLVGMAATAALVGAGWAGPVGAAHAADREYTGVVTDPAGDAEAGVAARDVTRASGRYDPKLGRFRGTVTMAAVADSGTAANVFVLFGTLNSAGTICRSKVFTGLSTAPGARRGAASVVRELGGGAISQRVPQGDSGDAGAPGRADVGAAAVTLSYDGRAKEFRNKRYDCLFVLVTDTSVQEPDAGSPIYDITDSYLMRRVGADLVSQGGRLDVPRGRWITVDVYVSNYGRSAARKVVATQKAGKGAAVGRKKVKVGTLRPSLEDSRRVQLRMKRTKGSGVVTVVFSGKGAPKERIKVRLR